MNVLAMEIIEPFDALRCISGDGVAEGGVVLVDSEDVEYGNTRIVEVVGFGTVFVAIVVAGTVTVHMRNMLSLLLILLK